MASRKPAADDRSPRPETAGDRGRALLPLAVDLDNTVLATDSLHEQAAWLLFRRPLALWRGAMAGRRGGLAGLKHRLAEEAAGLHAAWPLNEDFVAWLRDCAAAGRSVHLVTAAHQSVADAVADRLGIFETATGTDGHNLKAAAKARHLAERFPDGFVYAGDSHADLAVWSAARGAVLVGTFPSTREAVLRNAIPIEKEFATPRAGLRDWIDAIRAHHWAKNLLIFVPLVLAHGWTDAHQVLRVVLGFLLLLGVTSATYIVNDLADLQADRRHWSKQRRPVARGIIPIRIAGPLAVGLIGLGLLGAFLLETSFALVLGGYVALTVAYSCGLKRIPLLDTLVIAVLFVARVGMGIALTGHAVSDWLLSFSATLFFSLALAKRHTEILRATEVGRDDALIARGYRAADADLTLVLGAGAGLLSILILILYIVEDAFASVGYGSPGWLRLIPPFFAVWVGRIWLIAHRGQMSDDPVSFALRDRASLLLGAGVVTAFLLAV
jgi:4-hydroxybenzoate polyprenyltransferase/phosphoserine phosphatase